MPRPKHKYHFIYKTTNLKNGKYYIGMHSTFNLNDGYLGSGDRLRRSVRKHGKENFKLEILEFFDDRESLAKREKELVNEEVIKDEMCMNIKTGGRGGIDRGSEAAMKWSKAGLAKRKQLSDTSDEYKKRIFNSLSISSSKYLRGCALTGGGKYWIGKKHKQETIEKMKESAVDRGLGKNNSQYGTCWITNGIENKKIKKTDSVPMGWELGRK